MAKLKFNSAGVASAKKYATSAKNTSASVKDGVASIQKNMQSCVTGRSNISSRLTNVKTNLTQIETEIVAIYQMVNNASIKYTNTESNVVKSGQAVAQSARISTSNGNKGAFLHVKIPKIEGVKKSKDKIEGSLGQALLKEANISSLKKKNNIEEKNVGVNFMEKYMIDDIVENVQDISDKDKELCKSLIYDISQNYSKGFTANFTQELVTNTIQSSGGFIQQGTGFINIATAVGHGPQGGNSFVILDSSVASNTLKVSNIGGKLNSIMSSSAAKRAIPLIGGAIDYIGMRLDGESRVDAGIKANVHTWVGLAGGAAGVKIGAAAGAFIGSAVPGIGTVAVGAIGGAVGFVAGVAITTVGNAVFDAVYENKDKIYETGKEIVNDVGELAGQIKESSKLIISDVKEMTDKGIEKGKEIINETTESITEFVDKTNNKISEAKEEVGNCLDNIGNALSSGWDKIKTVWA